eukprot:NODE_11002_length_291_cov_44.478814.p4 GENE.NODE_11002_length_291_cov_44.478814~~NODE_11002_length_291_cov_44.478814.p4  ORF type:complete len:53 (-),score=0.96 NODE_11002_length_291_cov_44.478814:131-289(-)
MQSRPKYHHHRRHMFVGLQSFAVSTQVGRVGWRGLIAQVSAHASTTPEQHRS